MKFGPNPFNPSRSLSTLADINRRSRELLAYRATQKTVQPTAPHDDLLAEDQAYLPKEPHPFREREEDQEEEQEESQGPHPSYPDDSHPDEDPEPSPPLPPGSAVPPPLALAAPALYGIAGRVVSGLTPHTEADPAAVLLQFLAAFGNLIGPAPHCRVGATRHGLNLFVVLVGESSKARKGTSWRQIASLLTEVDPLWVARRITTARPTPYAILNPLRDQDPPT